MRLAATKKILGAGQVMELETITENPQRILIVKTHAIGDVLLTTPAIHAIRERYPQARVTMVTGAWSAPALANNGDLDELITFQDELLFKPHPIKLIRLFRGLKKQQFDVVVSFHASRLMHFLCALTGAPIRIGMDESRKSIFLTHRVSWQPNSARYISDNYLDVARLLSCKITEPRLQMACSPEERAAADDFLKTHNASEHRLLVAMAPAGGVNPRDRVVEKRWMPGSFAQLIREVLSPRGAMTILLGGPNEKRDVEQVAAQAADSSVINACGSLKLGEAAALISRCRLLISCDSALMHVAVAMGVRSVSIFGPTNPAALLPPDPRHRFIKSDVDCSPCYSNSKFPGCKKDGVCMQRVSHESVRAVVLEQLKELPP